MKRIRRFLQLSWSDRTLLIQSTIILLAMVVGLRVFPLSRLQQLLRKSATWQPKFTAKHHPSAEHIARTVRVASRFVPQASCLPQALTTQFMLIQRSYPADLQIGVAMNEVGQLEAHAWVTSKNGIVLGGTPDSHRYRRLLPNENMGIENHGKAI